jgi:hypothetical protein
MAAFRTHFSTGLAVGYLASVATVAIHWATSPFAPLLVFVGTCVGSLLPDLDSDHSTPFAVTFGLLSILSGGLAFGYCMQHPDVVPGGYWIGIPPLVALFVRYGVGRVFQKFTVHRGIFHSLPMMVIVTGITAMALEPFHPPVSDVVAISLGVGMGFLAHLILDEMYSAISFDGLSIEPKKSFGTALTLTSPSTVTTISAYVALGMLIFWNWPLIQQALAVIRNEQ